jgi:hypothetical protein
MQPDTQFPPVHDCDDDPEHDDPLQAGVGLVQVLVCVQDDEHVDQSDQPPSTVPQD